jgi:hypothetical protein
MLPPFRLAATVSCWRAKSFIPPIIGAAGTQRRSCRRGNHRKHTELHRKGAFSNNIAPGVSFAAALRGSAAQQHRPQAGQQSFDNMLRVVTLVQQIKTEFDGALSEEDKIVAITKIVLNLMKSNGQ